MGPASGVLMIPRSDWHSDSNKNFVDSLDPAGWPNILIGTDNTRVESGAAAPFLDNWETNVFSLPTLFVIGGLDYWRDMVVELSREIANLDPMEATFRHGFTDHFGKTFMNTTSYDRRALGNWTGGTNIKCSMKDRFMLDKVSGRTSSEMVKSVMNMQAIDSFVTCRSREKMACSKTAVLSGNHSDLDWCYMSVNKDNSTLDVLRTSQDLLMASNSAEIRNTPPTVWVTEGPRIENNSHYSESIEIVIERSQLEDMGNPGSPLIVCSFSAAIVSGIATSFGIFYTGEGFEYFNHIVLPDGGTAEPRKFLFHENWLDRAYAYSHKLWQANISMEYPDTFLYPSRPRKSPPSKNLLSEFGSAMGESIMFEQLYTRGVLTPHDAYSVELSVGGALTYLLSWTPPAASQYSMPYDQIPPQFTQGLSPPRSFAVQFMAKVYHEGYGFHLSTRTGYLGVTVLLLHAVIAIVGSLWQLIYSKSVILGWNSVPDYTMLGAGSPSLAKSYLTTNAGKEALGGLIAVRKVKPPPPPDTPPLSLPSSLDGQYGIVVMDYPSRASTTIVSSDYIVKSGAHESTKEIA